MGIIIEIFTMILGAAFMFTIATIITISIEDYYSKRKAIQKRREEGGGIKIIK